MPNLPHYKEKDGEYILVSTNQQCRIENGVLKFPKIMNMEVKTRLNDVNLREVRIIPKGIGYVIEIVYEKEIESILEQKPQRITGIDIGVRNLVTIGNNISEQGIAVKAGLLKSINQFYNKENARLKSISDLQQNQATTKRLQKISVIRNRKVKDLMHKASRAIVEYTLNRKIDNIVISHNDGWKQSSCMGRKPYKQMQFS